MVIRDSEDGDEIPLLLGGLPCGPLEPREIKIKIKNKKVRW